MRVARENALHVEREVVKRNALLSFNILQVEVHLLATGIDHLLGLS